jgi:catalase (peroxidase I)
MRRVPHTHNFYFASSGWEGAWTTNPAQWDNEFFKNLFYYEWELHTGEGGKDQWKPVVGPDIMMLTSDLALAVEPYREHSERYANDQGKLEEDFAAAWYKLTTADMGPASRCIGDDVPPPQPFQNDLPPAPAELPDYVLVRARIEKVLDEDDANADALINLAYRCAATFRKTDWHGGCNGARIRFPPESEWPENKNSGTQKALALLELVKEEHGDVSYSDLIVLAGLTALESENEDLKLPFCGGRVDTENESNSKDLRPRHYTDPLVTILDDWSVKGLTQEEGVALTCRERVGSQYYKDLLADESSFDEYARALLKHEDLLKIVNKFAQDESKLLKTFEAAWTKMMTADRFKGYNENACTGVDTPTK